MNVKSNMPSVIRKTTATLAFSLLSIASAQASTSTVSGTIHQQTNPNATTLDYWRIDLSADSVFEVDVLANEGYLTSKPGPPGAYSDLNGDGEITLMDSHLRIYKNSVATANEVATADDSAAYSDGSGDGWGDGSLNSRDSYGMWEFTAGTYILAFGDYNVQAADPVAGINAGDTLGSNQTHADYQIKFAADVPFTVTPTTVPLPAAVWLFGSAIAGLGFFGRKKQA